MNNKDMKIDRCFSKETIILMSDKSEKMISEIMCGDKIYTKDGGTLHVSDVINGYEETIYCIRTERGNLIELTGEHPLATSEGTVRAKDVRVHTLLLCEEGYEEKVEFIYLKPYEDQVYNIITEGGSNWIVANGILAGDFSMQNDEIKTIRFENILND